MKRILIVDDDDHIREVATVALETIAGHEVVEAKSAAEALEVAGRACPDVILLDVMMPVVDGPETFRRLQKSPETRGIPVVLLTAKVQASDLADFHELGVAGIIPKPFDPVALADQIARILEWDE